MGWMGAGADCTGILARGGAGGKLVPSHFFRVYASATIGLCCQTSLILDVYVVLADYGHTTDYVGRRCDDPLLDGKGYISTIS